MDVGHLLVSRRNVVVLAFGRPVRFFRTPVRLFGLLLCEGRVLLSDGHPVSQLLGVHAEFFGALSRLEYPIATGGAAIGSRWNTEEVAAHLTEELREDLLARWSETHRKHHTITHLHATLDAVGLLADAGIDFDREAVELATWFHDAICEIGRDDNEDRSAELAYELLESSPIRDEVARLVRVTKTHKVADDDVNGAVLSDADLSVLGSEPLRYRAYAATVRQEYADVPDEVFKPARVQALSALLEGPLFHTTVARQRWEERARQNIAEEIAALTG